MNHLSFHLRDIKPLKAAPIGLVAMCEHYTHAIQLCMQLSEVKRTGQGWAEALDMKEGTLNQILNQTKQRDWQEKRKRYFDPEKFDEVERLAGNTAISQYFDMKRNGQLNCQNQDGKRQELLAQKRQIEEQLEALNG